MKKIMSVFLLSILLISSLSPVIAADNVTDWKNINGKDPENLHNSPSDLYVNIEENGEKTRYEPICIEPDPNIQLPGYNNSFIYVTNDIRVQKGVIDYIVANVNKEWNTSTLNERIALQSGVWGITTQYPMPPSSNDTEILPDSYKRNKTLGNSSNTITTTETLANGTIVTRTVVVYTKNILEFTFRMLGDGFSTADNIQEVLMFKTKLITNTWYDIIEEIFTDPNPPEEPETPINETPETPDTPKPGNYGSGEPDTSEPNNDNNKDLERNNPENPDSGNNIDTGNKDDVITVLTGTEMKNTGIPIIFLLLILLTSLGFLIRKE